MCCGTDLGPSVLVWQKRVCVWDRASLTHLCHYWLFVKVYQSQFKSIVSLYLDQCDKGFDLTHTHSQLQLNSTSKVIKQGIMAFLVLLSLSLWQSIFLLHIRLFYCFLISLFLSLFLSHTCCKMLFKALKGWTVIFKKLNEYACWLLFLPERDDALLMRSSAFSVASSVCLIEFYPEGPPTLREEKSPTPMEQINGWISNAFSAAHIVPVKNRSKKSFVKSVLKS